MIPSLKPGEATSSQYFEFLSELQLRGFEGDVSTSFADRTVLATDNSIYQVTPQGILFPFNGTDVMRIARLSAEPRFASIVLTPVVAGRARTGNR
jgi:(R)-2-hydroxyglutarate dehydrogenase